MVSSDLPPHLRTVAKLRSTCRAGGASGVAAASDPGYLTWGGRRLPPRSGYGDRRPRHRQGILWKRATRKPSSPPSGRKVPSTLNYKVVP
eukprot:1185378-Prorocentrum_minimum.AAC.3